MVRQDAIPDGATHRILIVDDHPIVREGLAALIARHAGLEVCGYAEDMAQALSLVEKEHPDLVVVDISLRESNGIDLIRQIRNRDDSVRMLVSSMYDETLYAERSLHAGAMGYINKQEATRNIITAIERVLSGKIYLSERMSNRLINRMVGSGDRLQRPSVQTLSDRELEVFRLIGNGQTTAEIAESLKLSVKTIETYRQRIKDKLLLKNTAELARHAAQWVLESS